MERGCVCAVLCIVWWGNAQAQGGSFMRGKLLENSLTLDVFFLFSPKTCKHFVREALRSKTIILTLFLRSKGFSKDYCFIKVKPISFNQIWTYFRSTQKVSLSTCQAPDWQEVFGDSWTYVQDTRAFLSREGKEFVHSFTLSFIQQVLVGPTMCQVQ